MMMIAMTRNPAADPPAMAGTELVEDVAAASLSPFSPSLPVPVAFVVFVLLMMMLLSVVAVMLLVVVIEVVMVEVVVSAVVERF